MGGADGGTLGVGQLGAQLEEVELKDAELMAARAEPDMPSPARSEGLEEENSRLREIINQQAEQMRLIIEQQQQLMAPATEAPSSFSASDARSSPSGSPSRRGRAEPTSPFARRALIGGQRVGEGAPRTGPC